MRQHRDDSHRAGAPRSDDLHRARTAVRTRPERSLVDARHGSIALVAEYMRTAVIERGGTNQVALLLQWEPLGNQRDVQWYVLGGPLASLDADARPGSGFGGELGAGFSFRRRAVPLLMEIMGQGMGMGDYATVRVGAQLGVVW